MTAGASPRPGAAALRALRLLLVAGAAHCTREGDLGGLRPEAPCDASCDDACVELATDPRHCGACGVVCSADEVCRAGACAWSWPTRWRTAYREPFDATMPRGWRVSGGACAQQGPALAPDLTPAWSLRPDWAFLRRVDPVSDEGHRAWVWRLWVEPPADRPWMLTGCVRTRVKATFGPDRSGLCFNIQRGTPDEIQWTVEDAGVATEPLRQQGRWLEARWEVAPSHRRARALLDGRVVWEGPISDADWDARPWWTVNVFRAGGSAGCNTGEFYLAEARVEVADAL